MITIDFRSRVPIYEQIEKEITGLIVAGALTPHDQLPSVRGLAAELGINFNTVKKAFSELESEGVIYTLAGRGSFIAENALGSEQLRRGAMEGVRSALSSARASGLSKSEILKIADEIYPD